MRKKLCLLLVLMLCMWATGCGAKSEEVAEEKEILSDEEIYLTNIDSIITSLTVCHSLIHEQSLAWISDNSLLSDDDWTRTIGGIINRINGNCSKIEDIEAVPDKYIDLNSLLVETGNNYSIMAKEYELGISTLDEEKILSAIEKLDNESDNINNVNTILDAYLGKEVEIDSESDISSDSEWKYSLPPKYVDKEDLEPEKISLAIKNILYSEVDSGAYIDNVTIDNKKMYISISTNDADLSELSLEVVAEKWSNNITETILEYPQLDNYWDTIVLNFESLKSIEFSKNNIKENEYGRYFEIPLNYFK